MVTIHNENILPFDCDDTLVMWEGKESYKPGPDKIEITDPYDGTILYLKPHKFHIKLLKSHKARGYEVVVWSQSGYKWAEAVVKALDLKSHVDLVMTKPRGYVDDLPCHKWMGEHLYFNERVDG